MDNRRDQLRKSLDAIARRTSSRLKQWHLRHALANAIRRALPLFVVIPVLALTAVLLARGLAFSLNVNLPLIIAATVLVPLAFLLVRWLMAGARTFDRRTALSEVDRQLSLKDRLLTADQFLESEQRSQFMEAAIEDAVASAEQAVGREYRPPEDIVWPQRLWLIPVVAAAMLLLVFLLAVPPNLSPSEQPTAAGQLPTPNVKQAKKKSTPKSASRSETKETKKKTTIKKALPAQEAKPRDATSLLTSKTKETAGETGAGLSADATSSSGDSQSRGVPSDQSQTPKDEAKKQASKKKQKKAKKPTSKSQSKKKMKPEKSGSTAGKGSAGGSSRNPTSTTWSSKDKVVTSEEDPFDDDEEVDEEDSEQEARGGLQPNLRDRRPPVSRDLTIGFGNKKNPDANGRGGPSSQKKSRGVASLVLGVPIPDHVKGQPNPGKTKIHQERVEPQAEKVAAIAASERAPRVTPVGYWPSFPLKPWMRTLVRDYFLRFEVMSSRAPPE